MTSEFTLEVVRRERKSSCQSALPGMHRREVPVRSPCERSISTMARVGAGVRWCSSCEHEVHDLSELDEDQASSLLRAHRGRSLCVRYATDGNGRLRFGAETLAVDRLTRRPRLGRFALAATVSLVLIGGCANAPTRNGSLAPTEPVVTGDPWVLTVDFSIDPEADIFLGMIMVTESDGFVDPVVFELEEAIIPESISGSRRD